MTGFYEDYDDTSGVHLSTAEQAATNAANSATAAATSATNAAASATSSGGASSAASTAAANAATSETNAASSATSASGSATAASTSANDAAVSESNAATSETNAATSATNASTSETNAAASASAASTSETNAATSETNAATSASTAATKASEASTSATNAATSETNAATSATNASNSASAASTSETNAASSATAASTSATNAATSATNAATSATNAATSETNASTSETNASNSATSAATAQTAAESARDAALAAFDSFDDRYLGPHSSDPTTDNDGDALAAGMLYFNTTTDDMKVYEGSSWVNAYASLSGALLATNNLSDLNNAGTARTNLGLGTAATTAASDYATAAQADQTVALTGAGATSISGTYPNFTITSVNTTYSVGDGGLTQNNFTDALKTKLDGVATNANNYTLPFTDNSSNWDTAFGWGNHASAGYLTSFDITTQTDTKYLRSNAADTAANRITFTDGISLEPNDGIRFGGTANVHLRALTNNANSAIDFSSGSLSIGGFGNTVWHAGNDGAGSGLDADNLDGVTWNSLDKEVGATNFNVDADNGAGLRFWNGSGSYRIYMSSSGASGAGRVSGETTSDYNMYFRMTGGTNRGFVFQSDTANRAGIDASGNIRTVANVDCNYLRADRIYSNNDGSTGYFYNDSGTRTAYTGGDFYIQSDVGNCYIYATNTYLGNSSGDTIRFRGNSLTHNGWNAEAAGHFRLYDNKYLKIGSGSDVEHFWNGSNYYTDINGGAVWYIRDGNSSNNSRFMMDVDNGNFHADGNIYAYSTSVSDEKLKKDITKVENALDKVSQLNGYEFTYLKDRSKDSTSSKDRSKDRTSSKDIPHRQTRQDRNQSVSLALCLCANRKIS